MYLIFLSIIFASFLTDTFIEVTQSGISIKYRFLPIRGKFVRFKDLRKITFRKHIGKAAQYVLVLENKNSFSKTYQIRSSDHQPIKLTLDKLGVLYTDDVKDDIK